MRPEFSEAEHRERMERTRKALKDAGYSGAVCVGPEHLYYIGGYEAHTHFSEQGLVFTTGDDEPTLVLREVDETIARECSWVKDIRTYHFGADDPARLIADVAREKGIKGKRIGVDLQSYAIPTSYGLRLMDGLGNVEDATQTIAYVRLIKSPQEIKYIREAAIYAKSGAKAAVEKAKIGMTEIQLAAEIEYAMRSRGSDYSSMPTWVVSGPRTLQGHGLPIARKLQQGDVIRVEFAGVSHRYHCVAMDTFFMGQPSQRLKDLFEATADSVQEGLKTMKIGGPVAEAEKAQQAYLAKKGLDRYAPMRFGIGISASYPPCWLDPLSIIRESKETFRPNMCFYVHTCIQIPDESVGVLLGGSYLLSDNGVESLDGSTYELKVV